MAPSRGRKGDDLSPFFKIAFDTALDGFIVHEHGRILKVNRSAARLLGLESDELPGRKMTDLIPSADQEAVTARMQERRGGAYTTTFVRPDGSTIPVIVNAVHHRIDGREVRVMAVRQRAEGETGAWERDVEVERLEQLNHFKTQLLNTAAHELNTPLTPLRLQVHLLRSESLGDLSTRQRKAIAVLERNVERLSMLVSDILDVARLESGHLNVDLKEVDLVELVEESAQSYEETARGVGVALDVVTDGNLMVEADARRILQVLYNLVSNGIKFTPEGGRVSIEVGVDDEMAYVAVTDTGLGMTEEQLAGLFEPFARVHDTETTAIPGTGLGLFISRGIVHQHKGDIVATSLGPGKGSSFRFTLPLASDTTPSVAPKPVQPSPMVTGPLAERLRELI